MTTKSFNKATADMRALNHFPALDDNTYKATGDYYEHDSAAEVDQFYGYVANALARYLATGDIVHVNRAVKGSLAAGRYRTFMRVAKNLVAHKWDKGAKKLIGKIDATKKGKLITVDPDSGLEKFEVTLKNNIESEVKHAKTKPAKAWDESTAIMQLIKKAQENGKDLNDLSRHFQQAVAEVAPKAPTPNVPDVAIAS